MEVDFDNKTATIKMKKGKTMKKETLNKAFEGSNYSCTKCEMVEKKDAEESDDTESEEG